MAEAPAEGTTFSFGLVLDAHIGECCDLAAAQVWDGTIVNVGEACWGVNLARREIGNSRTSTQYWMNGLGTNDFQVELLSVPSAGHH